MTVRSATCLPVSSARRARLALWFSLLLGVVLSAGCREKPIEKPPTDPADAKPVRVLVIDDEPLAGALGRTWRSRSEAPIEVTTGTEADLTETGLAEIDLVIYPPRLLGELVEAELLEPLSSELLAGEQVVPQDILPQVRRHELTWGEATYALPFGSPPLLLCYRADIFETRGLTPPTTWSEYQSLLPKLADPPAGVDAANWSATCEPLAGDWAVANVLARAAAYARHKSHYSTLFDINDMQPLIATPPYQRALEELAAAVEQMPSDHASLAPADCRQRLARGECAIAWSWLTAADAEMAASLAEGSPALAFAPLPGSADSYNFSLKEWETRAEGATERVTLLAVSGRVGSICRQSPRRKAASAALAWLTSSEWSTAISPASSHTTLFRGSQVGAPGVWCPEGLPASAANVYADAVVESLTTQYAERGLVLPGGAEYEASLRAAIERVLAGETTTEDSLASAATKWEEITERRGRNDQAEAYRRCLGL